MKKNEQETTKKYNFYKRLFLVCCLYLLYGTVMLWEGQTNQMAGLGALVSIPSVLCAWFWGMWVGAIVSVISMLYNAVLFELSGLSSWELMVVKGGLFGGVAMLFLNMGIGWASDVRKQLRKELRKREEIEQELRREITRRKELEEHLIQAKELAQEASNSKSMFLANMSHELRTPLNAIIGYAELLQEDFSDKQQLEPLDDLENIGAAGKHLLHLLNDLLDLSKIEANKFELHYEIFPVQSMLQEVIATIHPLLQKNHNTFIHEEEELGDLEAAPKRVRQILFNILSNASKFAKNESIHLQVKKEKNINKNWYVFQIKDTGIGMSPSQLEKAFDTFVQVSSNKDYKVEGTGLGLSICDKLCKEMGGKIHATSELGKGSTFEIWLPEKRASSAQT